MTETRRIKGDPRLGFATDYWLEDEQCVECGASAEHAIEDRDGTTHYCSKHLRDDEN